MWDHHYWKRMVRRHTISAGSKSLHSTTMQAPVHNTAIPVLGESWKWINLLLIKWWDWSLTNRNIEPRNIGVLYPTWGNWWIIKSTGQDAASKPDGFNPAQPGSHGLHTPGRPTLAGLIPDRIQSHPAIFSVNRTQSVLNWFHI